MQTRREFIKNVPTTAGTLALGWGILAESAASAEAAGLSAEPLKGHFHPKGKPASRFTKGILATAKDTLPFADTRDIEEQKKGFIAPMKELKIQATPATWPGTWSVFSFLN
jgi:alkyl sulfatase BDS1-like metallo-beta-lactamase superfamily hydrolase